jgi:hypothetical protein
MITCGPMWGGSNTSDVVSNPARSYSDRAGSLTLAQILFAPRERA